MTWLKGVLIGLDELTNAVSGGAPGETISSRLGRSGLNNLLDRFLSSIEADHSTEALQYTPWGTVDPHQMREIDQRLSEDWDRFVQVMRSEQGLDVFTEETMAGAERAARRLRVWTRNGGAMRWKGRMALDVWAGESFAGK